MLGAWTRRSAAILSAAGLTLISSPVFASENFAAAIEKAVRLLPKPPVHVAVIDAEEAKPEVRETLLRLDAFVVKGSRVVYLTKQSAVLRGASQGSALHTHMLAAIIWHEMAHAEGAVAAAGAVERPRWRFLPVPDPVAAWAARDALDLAWTRLGGDRCRQILRDFTDRDRRPLDDSLAALGMDVQTYLTTLVFMDDTRHSSCVDGVLAFTVPGSRVVRVCSEALKRTSHQGAEYVAIAFIHEMLHTLGLGENPPSSDEITRRVRARCSEADRSTKR